MKYYYANYCSYTKRETDKGFHNIEEAIAYALNTPQISQVDEFELDSACRVKKRNNVFMKHNSYNLHYLKATTYLCGKKEIEIKQKGKDRFNLFLVSANATTIKVYDEKKEVMGVRFDDNTYLLLSIANSKTKEMELWAIPFINNTFVSQGIMRFKEAN